MNSCKLGSPTVWKGVLFVAVVGGVCAWGASIVGHDPEILAGQAAVSTAYATWALFCVTALLLFGIVVAWAQLRAEHERSRREFAIRLGADWINSQCERNSDAMRLINAFGTSEIDCVKARKEMWVDGRHQDLLTRVFPTFLHENLGKLSLEEKAKTIHQLPDGKTIVMISADQSAELRWLVVQYLNQMEVVLSAWLKSIADKEMIEEEFMPLVDSQEGDLLAARFRQDKQNGSAWPAIKAFVDEWRKRNDGKSTARPAVV